MYSPLSDVSDTGHALDHVYRRAAAIQRRSRWRRGLVFAVVTSAVCLLMVAALFANSRSDHGEGELATSTGSTMVETPSTASAQVTGTTTLDAAACAAFESSPPVLNEEFLAEQEKVLEAMDPDTFNRFATSADRRDFLRSQFVADYRQALVNSGCVFDGE